MSEQIRKKIYERVMYLSACALAGESPDPEVVSGVDVESIYSAASRHNMGALVTAALDKIGLASDDMRTSAHRAARKIMLLDAERAEILSELEREGIRYLPLKGAVIKELYPRIGLREMSDNDILFDEVYRASVRDIFKARGYNVKSYGKSENHDVYVKEPLYNYEMHVSLFRPLALGEELIHFFDGAMDRAVSDGVSSYGRRMTNEDFYIYMKTHEYKHYIYAGTGIRLFADTFVFMRAYGESLDWGYVNEVCERIGIAEYERHSRTLSMKLMNPAISARLCLGEEGLLTDEEYDLLFYCCTSGAYGRTTTYVKNGIHSLEKKGNSTLAAKFKYVMRRLFPPVLYYRTYYPFAYRHRWAIPFVAVWRFFKVLILAPKRILVPFRTVIRYKGKEK
mgnify:CR=1 FL=1